jgi:3'-phosphoadenosine 5'-phosphosulfate sulfotransferase (PAPS reductase)/FAD synthetase
MDVISLGWGIQSWTLVARIALGDAPPVDYVIHSDTTWEKSETYKFAKKWTPWLEEKGIPLVTVSDVKTKQIVDKWSGVFIPAFTIGENGKRGQLRRQCTIRWKIEPIRRFLRKRIKEQQIKLLPGIVNMQLGITTDEFMRARDSDAKYIKNVFPFLELDWNRVDCLKYLNNNNLPVPVKSSCTFCPYHSIRAWNELSGADLEEAIMVDESIRDKRGYPLFVHPDRIPLKDVKRTYTANELDTCDSGYCFL